MGSALALSIAGYFATRLRLRPHNPPPPSSSAKTRVQLDGINALGLKDVLQILSSEEELAKAINGTSISTKGTDEEGFLKEEEQFAKIVHGTSIAEEEFLKKEEETAKFVNVTSISTPTKNTINEWENEKLELERENAHLKNLVEALKERERALEVQLLAHYALKERELESGVRINAVKFEPARDEVKVLESKFQYDILEDEETGPEVENKLAMAKALEEEMDGNLKLVHHLESMKMASASDLEDLKAEASHLREENEKLRKEIEQLRIDRCIEDEELVHLRWVNACLRCELRNHQHSRIGNTDTYPFDFDAVSSSKSSRSSKSRFLGKIRKLVSKDKAHGTPTSSTTSRRSSSGSECSTRRLSSFN